MSGPIESDDYELIKKEELEKHKLAAKKLQESSPASLESSVNLIEAMDRLAEQVNKLVKLFEHANKEMYEEYEKGFHDESVKLDKVIRQNERIAKGLLAVADIVQRSPDSNKENKLVTDDTPEGSYPLAEDEVQEPHEHISRHKLVKEFR